ncbi:PadR family transcriptional regulator [Microbacterium sp. NPDC055903]
MSVRQSLLAILDQGPCYGYQLRAEFDRRTGSTWPLNVGQIYNTLERLERDGLVSRGEPDEHGHVYWEITPPGSSEVTSWLSSPVRRAQASRDELAIKLSLTATLPGADATEVIRTQRTETERRRSELADAAQDLDRDRDPAALTRALILDAMIFSAEAELRWLDHAEQRLSTQPPHAMALEIDPVRPRRGRPTRAVAV